MSPEEFVQEAHVIAAQAGYEGYRETFEVIKSNDSTDGSDKDWLNSMAFINRLEDNDRDSLLSLLKLVSMDTASQIFGVLKDMPSLSLNDSSYDALDDLVSGKEEFELELEREMPNA